MCDRKYGLKISGLLQRGGTEGPVADGRKEKSLKVPYYLMIKSGRERVHTDQKGVIIGILGRRESQSHVLFESCLLFKNGK